MFCGKIKIQEVVFGLGRLAFQMMTLLDAFQIYTSDDLEYGSLLNGDMNPWI